MLSEQALKEFKQIYQREVGVELKAEDVLALATEFAALFSALYRPIKKDWVQ